MKGVLLRSAAEPATTPVVESVSAKATAGQASRVKTCGPRGGPRKSLRPTGQARPNSRAPSYGACIGVKGDGEVLGPLFFQSLGAAEAGERASARPRRAISLVKFALAFRV